LSRPSSQRAFSPLVGNTPLVELKGWRRDPRSHLREARGPKPDRLDQGSRREGDDRRREASGDSAGPRAAPADERQHRRLARADRELRATADARDAGERDEERRRLLRLYGATIVESPGDQGSNGAVKLALELAEGDPRYFMPFQYANPANPRAHFEGTGAEIAEALDRVDVLVAGLGTGGTLMGTGDRLRESFPDVVVAAAEPLPGDPVMGLRSLEDGYVPPILDISKLDRKVLVSNEQSIVA
jgi:cysteine synthase B